MRHRPVLFWFASVAVAFCISLVVFLGIRANLRKLATVDDSSHLPLDMEVRVGEIVKEKGERNFGSYS